MSVELTRVIFTIINFIILYAVLRHFLFKPVNNAISARQSEIGESIKKTKEDEQKAAALKAQREEQLKSSRQEGLGIVEQYKVKAESVSADILKEANSEAQSILERARKEVEREQQKAEHEIKNQVVDLALLLSSKALEESIDEEKHRRLIQDFIAKVGI